MPWGQLYPVAGKFDPGLVESDLVPDEAPMGEDFQDWMASGHDPGYTPSHIDNPQWQHYHQTRHWVASAEQAQLTGGMVALYPRTDDAYQLAVPGGDAPENLHLTLAYAGEDVGGMDPGGLTRAIAQLADSYTVITARVMGHASFNPDGGEDGTDEPCSVYIISDSEQLSDLHKDVLDAAQVEVNLPTQHLPWIPHLTCGYNLPVDQLSFTGQVLFDRLGVAWQNTTQYFPLMGATIGEYETG